MVKKSDGGILTQLKLTKKQRAAQEAARIKQDEQISNYQETRDLRKKRTRRLIVLGAAMLNKAEANPKAMAVLEEILAALKSNPEHNSEISDSNAQLFQDCTIQELIAAKSTKQK